MQWLAAQLLQRYAVPPACGTSCDQVAAWLAGQGVGCASVGIQIDGRRAARTFKFALPGGSGGGGREHVPAKAVAAHFQFPPNKQVWTVEFVQWEI